MAQVEVLQQGYAGFEGLHAAAAVDAVPPPRGEQAAGGQGEEVRFPLPGGSGARRVRAQVHCISGPCHPPK
jgi:hypothetical protein